MLNRAVQLGERCKGCPYEPIDVSFNFGSRKVNAFDVDLVLEVGKRIKAIMELKRYAEAANYRYFFVPAGEYVGVKKVAKSLHVPFFVLVHDGSRYYVSEVDRFSCQKSITWHGKRAIAFPREKFVQLSPAELEEWFRKVL